MKQTCRNCKFNKEDGCDLLLQPNALCKQFEKKDDEK